MVNHISGHLSATGRAQDRESSPARDRRSTAVPYNHPDIHYVCNNHSYSYYHKLMKQPWRTAAATHIQSSFWFDMHNTIMQCILMWIIILALQLFLTYFRGLIGEGSRRISAFPPQLLDPPPVIWDPLPWNFRPDTFLLAFTTVKHGILTVRWIHVSAQRMTSILNEQQAEII